MSSQSPDEIKALLDLGYKADSAPKLEAVVHAQVNGETPYCFEANRTLLKLYQFFPHLQKDETTARILLLSLLKFPSTCTDLLALLCMVPERVQTTEPSATIIRCAELLDSCQFSEFWTVFKSLENNESLLPLVKSGTDGLCQSIASVLQLSYRTAPLSVVQSALNTQNVDAYVESVNGDLVTFAATTDNTKRGRVFQEGVTFFEVASLMSKARVAKE